ncbi:uncharacterized protein EV420DRAFT_1642314 [Desarmillaria tabescens]|uniref:DUF6534 domain-containing protein n=1 Tax=Armillaria tabescens TaxID=1929756 RepID=A0AA39N663_ARMTA|nr:uncharacterized protein EV420DRAFT_1642314 [Desarmillaria tabescens]KAK0459347.1 hypothetical protein EV420DRAFT_1642314 [Desarmillaria tabescens]
MSGAAACVCQVFYAYRIFILSKSQIVPIFVTCVSLTSSVGALITGVYSFQAGSIINLSSMKVSIAIGIWCGASALCDIVIAICMTYYLMRSNTNFRRTRVLVTKLIRLIIETGTVTDILYDASPHYAQAYANTVYVVLNSRIQILGGRDTYTPPVDMNITSSSLGDTSSQSTEGIRRTERRAPVVAIAKEVFSDGYEMGRMNDKPQDYSMSLSA